VETFVIVTKRKYVRPCRIGSSTIVACHDLNEHHKCFTLSRIEAKNIKYVIFRSDD
jgi:hypothetical protein